MKRTPRGKVSRTFWIFDNHLDGLFCFVLSLIEGLEISIALNWLSDSRLSLIIKNIIIAVFN